MKRGAKIFFWMSGVLAAAILIFLLYYNKADQEALDIAGTMDKDGGDYYFRGSNNVGFIIFPGVKVDEKAFSYMAKLLHEEGHTVVLPRVMFHISGLGTTHGSEIIAANPEIDKWFLIGHSMGGMPISNLALSETKVQGIAFLGSYTSIDLSGLDISAIRIMASHDTFIVTERAEEQLGNLPANSTSVMIEGASHQGYGSYNSWGDRGGATLPEKEQQEQTVRLMLDFFDAQINE